MSKREMAVGLGLVLLTAACGGAERDDAGDIVEEGDVSAFKIAVGDCLNTPSALDEISEVEGVPCTEPHNAQAYHAYDLTDGDYPGLAFVQSDSQEQCLANFAGFMGIDFANSPYYISTLYPTQESWDLGDDREVLCLVTTEDGSPTITQDLEGTAIALGDALAEPSTGDEGALSGGESAGDTTDADAEAGGEPSDTLADTGDEATGTVSAFALVDGQCLNYPSNAADGVDTLEATECTAPHNAQVYHLSDLADGDFPGTTAVSAEADSICLEQFEPFIGRDYATSEFYISTLFPTEQSWAAGDREIVCLATTEDYSPTITEDLRGSGR